MTLNDRNAAVYQILLLFGDRCAKLNEKNDRPILSAAEDSTGSLDFSYVRAVCKFAGITFEGHSICEISDFGGFCAGDIDTT